MIPQSHETWHFDTSHIGREVLVFDELGSTNTFLAELAAYSAPAGTIVLARQQTAGRGRYGRVWQSRPGASLLMSVLLTPPLELRRPAVLTAWAALAVADAVYQLAGVQARIKWPNDLLIRGKKICGILIEQGVRAGQANAAWTVAGVGLNLNQTLDEFAERDLPDACSLASASGKWFELRSAADAVISCLDREYGRLVSGERVAVEADWKWRVGLLGRTVAVERTDGAIIHGRLREMSFDGLELETEEPVPFVIPPEAVAHVWALESSAQNPDAR